MRGPKATISPDEGAGTSVYLALLPIGASEPMRNVTRQCRSGNFLFW